jgi:dCMP deaminase
MRISFDEYFMRMAVLASDRATCVRLNVGAVLIKNKNVIATGYNGSAPKEVHCIEEGCLIKDGHCIRTIHAEQNALLQCAKNGVNAQGATIYVTHQPCLHCTKSLITAGISEIIFLNEYRKDEYALHLMNIAGVKMRKVEL